MEKIILIQTASIGDVILTTPVLEKVHHYFPTASIDILVKQGMESLFIQHPFIHRVIAWGKNQHKYRNLFKLIKKLRSEKYDLAINCQRFASTGLLTVGMNAKITTGFHKNPFSKFFTYRIEHTVGNLHEVERNLSLIDFIGQEKQFPVRLYPTKNDYEKVAHLKNKPYICIAPASLWFTKQFPESKWIEFIRLLPEDLVIYLLGSANEKILCDSIMAACKPRRIISLAGELSFLQVAALMREAKINYVNDSAPLHLASAVNAPVAAIFCSTVPEFGFGPRSEHSFIIQTSESLSCRPCGLHGHTSCPKGHFKCAYSIQSQQLLKCLLEVKSYEL